MEGEFLCHYALVICGVGWGWCVVLLFLHHCFYFHLWKMLLTCSLAVVGNGPSTPIPKCTSARCKCTYSVLYSPFDRVDSCDVSLKQICTCVNCRQLAPHADPLSRPYTAASRPSSSHSQYSSSGDGKSRAKKKKHRLQRYLRFAEFVCNALVRSSTNVSVFASVPMLWT